MRLESMIDKAVYELFESMQGVYTVKLDKEYAQVEGTPHISGERLYFRKGKKIVACFSHWDYFIKQEGSNGPPK